MLLYRLAAFLLFAAAACSIHLVMHARHAYTITAELHPQQPRHRRVGTSKSTTSGGRSCHKLQLGFDYPELRPLKQHLATLLCEPPTAADIQAAYASILGLHTPCHGSNSANPATHLASFLTAAQQLLAPHSLRRCGWDPSLLEALQLNRCEQKTRHPMGPHATNFTAQEQDDNNSRSAGLTNTTTSNQAAGLAPRVLLAANLHNSGHMLPNFVAQTLQLALLLPPGGLGVSLYESGSSDLTRFWITLLHLLLLPLGTPHYFVTGGSLRPTQGLPRIQLMAALRNAALEPVVSPPHLSSTSSHEGGSSSSSEAGWLPGFHQHGRKQRGAGTTHRHPPRRTSQQVLSHGMDGFLPDTIAFSNDVFLCAGDVLRLAAHRADLSCGMDFYVGPWEAGPGAQWTSAHPLDPQQQQQQQEEEEEEEEEAGPGLHRAPTHSVNTQQQQQKQQQEEEEEEPGVGSGGAGSSGVGPVGAVAPAPQQLRFYDKWVARDIRGGLLSNTPPYLLHLATLQQLTQGLPVPMYCCWNGLAVMRAAPLLSKRITFRNHSAGECRASECSLLCDDLHAAGYHHVVMDPGVQLAYDADQMGLLGQGMQQQQRRRRRWRRRQQAAHKRRRYLLQSGDASTADVVAGGSHMQQARLDSNSGSSSGGVVPSKRHQQWLPVLPWSRVAPAASAVKKACRTEAEAALTVRLQGGPSGPALPAAAAVEVGAWRWVECCDLQPGHNYVNFTAHCHPVDVVAQWDVTAAAGR